ncbi:hypothetical protein BJV77DRAFT_1011878 [Russula vinacea]|nr:hypothetical protein BJV77DRAFT_1011878 [Russula vinacea]
MPPQFSSGFVLMWMRRRTGAHNIPNARSPRATRCCRQYRMIGFQTSAGELIKGRMIEDPDTLGSWSLSSIC